MPRKGSLTRRNREVQTFIADNRVVLYVRASTPEQVNSLDAQKMRAVEFCTIKDLIIDAIFVDAGVSALHCAIRDRPQAKIMFAYLRKHSIGTVLVLRMDRAFRTSLDFSQTIAWSIEQSFAFRFIEPDINYGTPMGRLFAQLEVARAEMECSLRSARVDDALNSLRDHRLSRNGSAAPYGWRAVPCDDGTRTRQGLPQFRHLPVPAEQAVLRHLQELWEIHKGHGALTRIANIFNSNGIPTKMAGMTILKNGKTHTCAGTWHPATVKSVLEHAILATATELPDGIPSLEQSIALLKERALPSNISLSPSNLATYSNFNFP